MFALLVFFFFKPCACDSCTFLYVGFTSIEFLKNTEDKSEELGS